MKYLDRLVRWSVRRREVLVRDPHRGGRRRVLLMVLGLVFGIGLIYANGWVSAPWATVVSVALGPLVVWGAMSGYAQAVSYRSGWLDGRLEMVNALSESIRRGLDPEDWLRGEREKDYVILGITPGDPDA